MKRTDVIVIGAGMAGLSLAALLGQAGIAVTVVDREDPGQMATDEFDSRTVALSAGTRAILQPLDIWDELQPFGQAITSIDVQEGHDAFLLNFDAAQTTDKAFGWIFSNSAVRRVLHQAAVKNGVHFVHDGLQDIQYQNNEIPAQAGIHGATKQASVGRKNGPSLAQALREDGLVVAQLQSGELVAAQLLIGADGRNSRVRALCGIDTVDLDYKQTALVGLVEHELPHHGLAVERFYPDGPFAILPFTDVNDAHRSAIVWTRHSSSLSFRPPAFAEGKLRPESLSRQGDPGMRRDDGSWDSHAITNGIMPMFDERFGAIKAVGKWAAFPLTLHHAKSFIADRLALISDAAHAIHPIAGQGLNLGMRDVQVLAQLLADAKRNNADLGAADLLQSYNRARRGDVFAMVAATDILNRLFGNNSFVLRHLRSAGLGLVDKIPPLKKFFMSVAMGRT